MKGPRPCGMGGRGRPLAAAGGRVVVVALPIVALACAGETDRSADVPRLRAEVTLEIGATDGPDEYIFGRVSGIAADSAGRIVVADAQAEEIRVYSPSGEFLYLAARGGSGPGEVRRPFCCFAFGPDGLLWVRDGGNGRYQTYRVGATAAEPQGTLKFAHGDRYYWGAVTFDSAGNLVDLGHRPGPRGVDAIVRFHRDRASGDVLFEEAVPQPSPDSVDMTTVDGRTQSGSMARFFLWQPFGSGPVVAWGPAGNWATGVSGAYAIRWVYPGGERIVRRNVAPITLSSDERADAEEGLAGEAKRAGISVRALPFGVPDTKPPLRGALFDAPGRLWVRLTRSDGDTLQLADVYDTTGRRVAQTTWPRSIDLTIGGIGREHTFGVRRDSLGVEQVVRVTWRRP
jgi:hypothetical protein